MRGVLIGPGRRALFRLGLCSSKQRSSRCEVSRSLRDRARRTVTYAWGRKPLSWFSRQIFLCRKAVPRRCLPATPGASSSTDDVPAVGRERFSLSSIPQKQIRPATGSRQSASANGHVDQRPPGGWKPCPPKIDPRAEIRLDLTLRTEPADDGSRQNLRCRKAGSPRAHARRLRSVRSPGPCPMMSASGRDFTYKDGLETARI
ncbi:hypothetical protein HPB50_016521 [Hyalomma asiaticum]|uniref:Uncharacterized protein n=1 Tax=Hyalomma asiaticum TaxID=266040 RepID=A0ACB7SZD0_HYAAI|nr:hypothetical protein HPB50_016521 [Hyalomma asiaticum]